MPIIACSRKHFPKQYIIYVQTLCAQFLWRVIICRSKTSYWRWITMAKSQLTANILILLGILESAWSMRNTANVSLIEFNGHFR